MTTYTTWGSVRGSCGHKHRSIEAACKCILEDQKGCRSQGGYSDRGVFSLGSRLYKGGPQAMCVLTEEEALAYEEIMDELQGLR